MYNYRFADRLPDPQLCHGRLQCSHDLEGYDLNDVFSVDSLKNVEKAHKEKTHNMISCKFPTPSILSPSGLMVVTGSESPIVVVLSGSMEPAFYRYFN